MSRITSAEQFLPEYIKRLSPASAEYLLKTTGPLVFAFADAWAERQLALHDLDQVCKDLTEDEQAFKEEMNSGDSKEEPK